MIFSFTVTVLRDATDLMPGQEPFPDGEAHHYVESRSPYGMANITAIRYQRFHGLRRARAYRDEQRAAGYTAYLNLGARHAVSLTIPTPAGVRR